MKNKKHKDYDYIQKYVGKHGAGFSCNSLDGILTCHFVTTKSKAYVMLVNIILLIRFFKRKISIIVD